MKKEGIKVKLIRVLLVLSLVAILVIAVTRGKNTPTTPTISQPQSVCEGCPSKTACEKVKTPEDTTKNTKETKNTKDTLCIKNTK